MAALRLWVMELWVMELLVMETKKPESAVATLSGPESIIDAPLEASSSGDSA
jgi:hypothetical protein